MEKQNLLKKQNLVWDLLKQQNLVWDLLKQQNLVWEGMMRMVSQQLQQSLRPWQSSIA